ncbi:MULTISPECIES: ComEC/Rec2 family competence protein [unclassified Brevibacterium]|uniref:ComEC/Rec2 family competence protein n=1 Tax=unclassified Brevibacterium TaxID=2614124 RepID=UPI0020172030|nr:ComEC/Rec2 family competence protein [Brevibacterium sp. 2SA]MCM1012593.1 ComEC/Rec2 family competence protein [Brevibacterium sp. XM4083]
MRLVLCAAGLWALALLAPGPWALVGAPVVIGIGFVVVRRRRFHHLGVGLIVFACLAAVQICVLTSARGPVENTETNGIVVGASTPGPSGWSRLTLLTGGGFAEVLAPAVPPVGARVEMRTERLDDIRITRDDPRVMRAPNAVWRWRAEMRATLRENSLAAGTSGGALLPGLVVGDTAPQDAQMTDDMRVVSLTHLSAVSGTNVTIVSLGAGLLAGACRAGPRTRVAVGVLTCLGYVFVVGFEPSAIRAAGMAVAVALVFLRGGGIAPVAVIAATVALLLTGVPVLATSVGFVLSVIATTVIMFVVPLLLRRLLVRFPLAPSVLVSALVVPLVAQLACTPVLVAIDPRLGGWSVVANALASPAVLPATVAGFVSLVAGGIGLPGLSWIAEFTAWLGSLCAWWIVAVARVCARLPGASLAWPDPPVGSLVALAVLALLTVGVVLLIRKRLWGAPVVVLAVALGAAVVVVGSPRPPARDWLVLACDVGQGSATVVNLGGGRGLVIDAGKQPGPIDECLDDSGIAEVDLAISHFDADHSGGAAGTTWSRTVGQVWVSANAIGSPDVAQLVRDTGAEVAPLHRGRRLDIGGVAIEVLWPPSTGVPPAEGRGGIGGDAAGGIGQANGRSGDGTAARNEDSLVFRVVVRGLTVLIPGDVGEEEQFVLAQSLTPTDVLLAPHHGSSDLSDDFYRAARAQLGIVSVGENRYGHPTERSLQAFGPVRVLRTDECGTIALYAGPRFSTARSCASAGGEDGEGRVPRGR